MGNLMPVSFHAGTDVIMPVFRVTRGDVILSTGLCKTI